MEIRLVGEIQQSCVYLFPYYMQNEYKEIRSKYKALCSQYQKLQADNSASLLQVYSWCKMSIDMLLQPQLRKENGMDKLSLEREVVLLRCIKDENVYDETRQNFVIDSLKERLKKSLDRIESLEKFIIEQDEVKTLCIVTSLWMYLFIIVFVEERSKAQRRNMYAKWFTTFYPSRTNFPTWESFDTW